MSPHLKFCRDLNFELIENYKPKAIISPGLGMARMVSDLYGLELVTSEKAANGNNLISTIPMEKDHGYSLSIGPVLVASLRPSAIKSNHIF